MISQQELVAGLQTRADHWEPEKLLRWGFSEFGSSVSMASSFGAEDVVLIDIASKITPNFRVFTLDTDFLFPETYKLMERIERRYGISVERLHSLYTPEAQAVKFGAELWKSQPDQCCQLRKVDPLKNHLGTLKAWITGVRRDQAPTRANTCKLEWDAKFGLVKLNPLADWTSIQVWEYIHSFNVPYNPLHDQNYPSIGCTHCTRPVQPGEDPRAGRWSGQNKIECGLHLKTSN